MRRRIGWKGWFAIGAGAVMLLGVTAYIFRTEITLALITPEAPFEAGMPAPAPDYGEEGSWAALPWREDGTDVRPAGAEKPYEAGAAPADVFFVHPTTYFGASSWNAGPGATFARSLVEGQVLRNQASAFNGCCDIYAPHYRQATLYAFLDHSGSGARALDLAYADVRRAFLHFLDRFDRGRPLILAGHSQGAYHAERLLEEFFGAGPLRGRLVAAYLIGMPLPRDKFAGGLSPLPPCAGPAETGCVVAWQTLGPEGDATRYTGHRSLRYGAGYEDTAGRPLLCVNPLTWRMDEEPAERRLHLGAVLFSRFSDAPAEPLTQLTGARCADGILRVAVIDRAPYDWGLMGHQDYHPFDISLFYMDIRANAAARVRAFLARQSSD